MLHRSRPGAPSSLAAALAVVLGLALVLAGCGGGQKAAATTSPGQVMTTAKQHFDQAKSVHIVLSTGSTPTSGNGVLGADGVITHAPAFQGNVKVVLSGLTATVPITSTGGKVYAKLPLQTKFSVIKPSDYGAPDPADFADPHRGLSALLTRLQGLKKGSQTRQGNQILTSYSGTLPGATVKAVIPSASAKQTYATVVGVDQQGYAATVKITGTFFSGSGDVTYDVTFDGYDKDVRITVPKT